MECALPVEILIEIACESLQSFRAMLALRPVVEFLRNNRKMIMDRLTIRVVERDSVRYYIGDTLHREDGPAIEYNDGGTQWYLMGNLNSVGDIPSVEWVGLKKMWHRDGLLHRDGDLPAVEHSTGTKEWYWHGMRHRDNNLPAIIFAYNTELYYKHDLKHRIGGPAVSWYNGIKEWWVEGVKLDID